MSNKSYPISYPWRIVSKLTGQPDSVVSGLTSGVYNRVGSNNPHWEQTIKAGGNASSSMVVDVDEPWQSQPHSCFMTYVTWPYSTNPPVTASTVGVRPPPAGLAYPGNMADKEQEVREVASTQFLRRLREQDHKFQGGVFFGEIVPTLKMLVRPFGSLRDGIVNYYRAANRNVRGKPRKSWNRIVGDTWLEYSFGWKPFLSDIKDAAQAAHSIYSGIRRQRISANAGQKFEVPTSAVRDFQENLMIYDVLFSNEIAYSVKYYGGLLPLPKATTGLEYLERIRNMSSFDLSSFIPTVWELIPYSFLIDYFSNIGQVLEAYSTDMSQLAWVSMVEKRTSGQKIQWNYRHDKTWDFIVGKPVQSPDTICLTSGQGSTYGNRHKQITRWSHASLTYPGLRFELPIKAHQFANMGALLLGSRRVRG